MTEEVTPRRRWGPTLLISAWVVFTLCFLVVVVPPFDEAYSHIRVDMPDSTQAVLQISRVTLALPYIIVPLAFVLPWWYGQSGMTKLAKTSRHLAGLGTLVVWAWMLWGLMCPFLSITEGIEPLRK